MASLPNPERTLIGGSLEISRMVSGLWQLAGGHHDEKIDIEIAARAMQPLHVVPLFSSSLLIDVIDLTLAWTASTWQTTTEMLVSGRLFLINEIRHS